MTAKKLKIIPDTSSYTVTPAQDVVQNQLDGGKPRMRRDIMGGWSQVACVWVLNGTEYDYFEAFYRYCVLNASTPFECDLVIGESELTTHNCLFVPGTKQLVGQAGDSYTINATLAVESLDYDPTEDETLIDGFTA